MIDMGIAEEMNVAPLVGAWIEITQQIMLIIMYSVAPLVGAWIEIESSTYDFPCHRVAPLVGAWIEIFLVKPNLIPIKSLLL